MRYIIGMKIMLEVLFILFCAGVLAVVVSTHPPAGVASCPEFDCEAK